MGNLSDVQFVNGIYIGPGGDVVIPEGMPSITARAFEGCSSLTSVVIPESVTSIGERAFADCRGLTNVVIPEGVTSIGESAFSHCEGLTSVVIPEGVTCIGKSAFSGCHGLTSVVIPEGVTSIGAMAFADCSDLKRIVIPEGVTSIGTETFIWCSKMTNIVIPTSVKNIGARCFLYCGKLNRVVIPESVISIDEAAFLGCHKLKTVDFMGEVPKLGLNVFQDCPHLELKPEIYFTTQKLAATLVTGVPRENIKVSAYIQLYQSGKAWMDVVEAAAKDHAAEIAEEIYGLLQGSTKVSAKAENNAAEFMLKWHQNIQPEQIKTLYQLLQNKKCKKAMERLESDIGIADLVKLVDDTAEAQFQHPVEQIVHANWKYTSQVDTLKKYIEKGIHYRGTEEVCSLEAVIFAIVGYSNQIPQQRKDIEIRGYKKDYFPICADPIADQVAAELDQEELLTLLEKLTYECEIGDCAVPLGRYADAQRTEHLISQMQKWAKWDDYGLAGRQNMILARGALMLNDTRPAMLHMEKAGRLEDYAKLRGTDADTLRDTVLAEFGLDSQGRKEYELGNKTVVARMERDLTLSLYDTVSDKVVKSIPKKGAELEKYEAAKKDFADLKKNIKKVVKSRSDLLFADFLSGRTREAGRWKQAYLTNPVLNQVAQLLVWNQGKKTFTLKGQNAIGSDGQPYVLSEKPVGVAHPIMMTESVQLAWQDYFAENHLKQLFEQVWEPHYRPEEIASNRYEGCQISAYRFMNQSKHGIEFCDEILHDWGYAAYSGDAGVNMMDCKLSLEPLNWVYNPFFDKLFILGKFTVKRFTRYANHIVYLLDKWTVTERILKDDVSVAPLLGGFTAAQISEFIRLATEKGCTNVTALLLEYQNEHFGQFDPMAEFTLGE